ncbi:MAG TPA: hypothetical protein VEQ65_12325 [Opitutus sp.]|nr:hypothetical protein [Opitutus sp.]
MLRSLLLFTAALLCWSSSLVAQETFVGSFAEPKDGGNLDTTNSVFDGTTVTIVPRSHASEALGGNVRWRNILFAIRGVKGKAPTFRLPLTSPRTGKMILSGDLVSFRKVKMVWTYQADSTQWNSFDTEKRSGTSASTWTVENSNTEPFTQDVVYVSINERAPVGDFYEWLEADVFTHTLVKPTPSEVSTGTFMIGYQSGAPASAACSRAIPDVPLYGFVIRDPAANPQKLVMLVSGQHPYEGQNKIALQSAVEWILKSDSPEAKAYRATYVTVVYPFVNPTGELAGLWRGTAYAPSKDTNRNWNTSETIPSRNRGIDTVIVHKNAMKKDIALLGLGEPYAVFDYHQNFGDRDGKPDYVLHASSSATSATAARLAAATDFAPYFARLSGSTNIAEIASDLTSQETLRGYMVARGVKLPLTFERSVYNTIASEWAFGLATVKALVDPDAIVTTTPTPVTPTPTQTADRSDSTTGEQPAEGSGGSSAPSAESPDQEPSAEEPAPTPEPEVVVPSTPVPAVQTVIVADDFTGGGFLNRRIPDSGAPAGIVWAVESGVMTLTSAGTVTANTSARASINAGQADAEVRGAMRIGPNWTGLMLRGSDSSNYLRFMISGTGWILQKTAAGSTTTIASGKGVYALDVEHTLVAVLSGSSIRLRIDGTDVGSAQVAFNQAATRHGLFSNGSGVRQWSSFEVRSATTVP